MVRFIFALCLITAPLAGCKSNEPESQSLRGDQETVDVDVSRHRVRVFVRPDDDEPEHDVNVDVSW